MAYSSELNTNSETFKARSLAMLERIKLLRQLEQRAADVSAKAKPMFDKRGQLLPRERIALLLDADSPWLAISSIAGYLQDTRDPATSIPGGGVLAGIGYISGTRCMVVASDSGIDAGAMQARGREKLLRAQELALQNKLPFVHLVESAGANLMQYKVDGFVLGGQIFRNLARLSAAGLPVITVQHGSGTAGGAYMPGLSDVVIMVRGRSRAFLAGPPLLKAATGEIATEEDLGGALMHTTVTGLGEFMAEDDRHALGLARDVIKQCHWLSYRAPDTFSEPIFSSDDLLGIMSMDLRTPVDMRDVITRLVDGSEFLEFKADYGSATVCVQASIGGYPIGIITNNGPIDVAGANKASHFIQRSCQLGHPLIYLQNTTGYMVGKDSEQAGMIKHGSKMIQAVTNATVAQITIQCGASYGAGNYGMCGRAFAPRFLFSWPGSKTAVMGSEQAATTMKIVAQAGAARKGVSLDPDVLQKQYDTIVNTFESQADAFVTSGLALDDGVIDPRDTRAVLSECLSIIHDASQRQLTPVQFAVARM